MFLKCHTKENRFVGFFLPGDQVTQGFLRTVGVYLFGVGWVLENYTSLSSLPVMAHYGQPQPPHNGGAAVPPLGGQQFSYGMIFFLFQI
jgi:hypothetical protein